MPLPLGKRIAFVGLRCGKYKPAVEIIKGYIVSYNPTPGTDYLVWCDDEKQALVSEEDIIESARC